MQASVVCAQRLFAGRQKLLLLCQPPALVLYLFHSARQLLFEAVHLVQRFS